MSRRRVAPSPRRVRRTRDCDSYDQQVMQVYDLFRDRAKTILVLVCVRMCHWRVGGDRDARAGLKSITGRRRLRLCTVSIRCWSLDDHNRTRFSFGLARDAYGSFFIRRGAGGTQRRRELAIACNLVVPRAPAPIEFPLEGNVTKNVIWVVLVAGVGNASKAVTACLDADGFVSRPHDGRVLDVACWKRDGS